MSDQKKPLRQFRLLDLFVLTTIAGIGLLAFKLGIAARAASTTTVAILTVGGTLSAFVAYLVPSNKRILWTVVVLVIYVIIIVAGL